MKQYVIDELRPADYDLLKNYLDAHYIADALDGIYWIPVPDELLTGIQAAHSDCRPHYFSVELFDGRMSCELLVRTKKRVRCDCMGYADEKQRTWLIETVDAVLDQLGIQI